MRAWRPQVQQLVVATAHARRLIRRRGNRLWVWAGENGLTQTGFERPQRPDADFERVMYRVTLEGTKPV